MIFSHDQSRCYGGPRHEITPDPRSVSLSGDPGDIWSSVKIRLGDYCPSGSDGGQIIRSCELSRHWHYHSSQHLTNQKTCIDQKIWRFIKLIIRHTVPSQKLYSDQPEECWTKIKPRTKRSDQWRISWGQSRKWIIWSWVNFTRVSFQEWRGRQPGRGELGHRGGHSGVPPLPVLPPLHVRHLGHVKVTLANIITSLNVFSGSAASSWTTTGPPCTARWPQSSIRRVWQP